MKPSSFSSLFLGALLLLPACGGSAPQPKAKTLSPVAPIMASRNVVTPKGTIPEDAAKMKVALLVPLSGDSAPIGNSMLDAASLALYDTYLAAPPDQIHTQIVLMPKDTGNTPADTAKAAKEALDQGAQLIIGPLFSQSVSAVAPLARERGVKMITFSNNKAVAGNGAYVFGFLPEQQVERMAEFAFLHNYPRVAVLAPNDAYGAKVKDTLKEIYTKKGGLVSPAELYAPSPANIDAAVARLAASYTNTPEDRRFHAIFLADSGFQLKTIIDSLKRHNIDLQKVKLLGTGLWDSDEITKIPEMVGAWFSSSPPEDYKIFARRFETSYGYKPARLSSLSYDAVALVAMLAMPMHNPTNIEDKVLTNSEGYISPANSLFRFRADGAAERRLAVLEITTGGFKVVEVAEKDFKNAPPPDKEPAKAVPAEKPAEKPTEKAAEKTEPAEKPASTPEPKAEPKAEAAPIATPPSTGSAPAAPAK